MNVSSRHIWVISTEWQGWINSQNDKLWNVRTQSLSGPILIIALCSLMSQGGHHQNQVLTRLRLNSAPRGVA